MANINQAVILAGGQGIRLRPLTLTTPKPMIRIHNKPFLEYVIEMLIENNITEVVILTGYLHEKIEDYFGNGEKLGITIRYSYSPIEDETGTRLRKAKNLLHEQFLLLYSDNFWPLSLSLLTSFYAKKGTEALVTVYSNKDKYSKNNIYVNEDGIVEIYDKKANQGKLNGVDIGFFIFSKKSLQKLPEGNFSLEKDFLPKLIKKKQLSGFITDHKYYGLSNLTRISTIKKFLKPKKTVFLDRDGVINKRAPKAQYITSWKDFKFLPHTKKALKHLIKKGYSIILISNQAGIARGMLTKKTLSEIHKKMKEELAKDNIRIKAIFFCPHGWDDGCYCRKPNPGLFFQAAAKYHINLFHTYCIGDDERDIIAGKKAGCKTYLVDEKSDLLAIVTKYL